MKIYTKTGDKGQTGLIGGTRVEKSDIRLETYGTVDELNANIGMLAAMNVGDEIRLFLHKIQNILFTVGSHLATDTTKTGHNSASVMKEEYIVMVEHEIDNMDEKLLPLNRFILPGGSVEAAQSHICRTIARRAERRIIEMNKTYNVDNKVIVCINRLSDYFFTLSRFIISNQKKQEIFWNTTN